MKDVTPLFVIHSGNTGSDVYRPLFNNIDCDKYPKYVIENIARYYIDLVKKFKPEYGLNNIRLMGWSYGGVVASEMAYQLANEGIINVEQLFVLDSPFYLNKNDMKQAKEREDNGYYRKYYETWHILKDMKSKNASIEKLIQNNHEAFQDMYAYVPKKYKIYQPSISEVL